MAKTFKQPGLSITMVAPTGGVVSGRGVLIGQLFGVSLDTVAQTLPFEMAIQGVFNLKKEGTLAVAVGDALYWDDTLKEVDKTSTAQKEVGYAVSATGAGAGETQIDVLLTPSIRTSVAA